MFGLGENPAPLRASDAQWNLGMVASILAESGQGVFKEELLGAGTGSH